MTVNNTINFGPRTTAPDTPAAGRARLYLENNSFKYVDSAGTVRTLSTGVTPEQVQDIVGTFLASPNNTLDINYNDAGNVLEIDLAAGLVTALNSALQPNDNVSELQNDAGYVNSAQAASAAPVQSVNGQTGNVAGLVPDARNVNTGTGLQGGGSLGADRTLSLTNTGVTAGNYTNANITVNSQGRVTSASNGSSNGAGLQLLDFAWAEDTSVTTTTNATNYLEKVEIGPAPFTAGFYLIMWSYNWSFNNGGDDFEANVIVNDVTIIGAHQQEPKDTAGSFGSTGTDQKHMASGFGFFQHPGGSLEVEIDYRSGAQGVIASIWNARLIVTRLVGAGNNRNTG